MFAVCHVVSVCSHCLQWKSKPISTVSRSAKIVRSACIYETAFHLYWERVDVLPYLSHLHDSPVWIMIPSISEACTCKDTVSSTIKCTGSSNLQAGHRTANGAVPGRCLNLAIWLRDWLIFEKCAVFLGDVFSNTLNIWLRSEDLTAVLLMNEVLRYVTLYHSVSSSYEGTALIWNIGPRHIPIHFSPWIKILW